MNKIINSFVYQRILEEVMDNPTIPAYLGETYSQCYEDVIIESIIKAQIKNGSPPKSICWIEIGANHPVCTSSTYLLERKYGITGYLVEANPKLIPALKKFRPNSIVINCAVSDTTNSEVNFYISPENEISSLDQKFVENWKDLGVQQVITVPTIRINNLLNLSSNFEFIYLSIDVEGYDIKILKDIDFNLYRPNLIQIEPSDGFIENSSLQIIEFLNEKNYDLIAVTDVNLIFKLNSQNI
jgi:FkbM family methyltransferase